MDKPSRGTADQTRRRFVAATVSGATMIGWAQSPALARRGPTDLPASLVRAWSDHDRATIRKDVAALAALVTDDYMLVNSDSSVQDKPSYLADFDVPGFRLEPYEIEQRVVRNWGTVVLTGGVFNLRWTQEGRRQARRLRFVHLWSREGGRWRIAYTQLTRVPE